MSPLCSCCVRKALHRDNRSSSFSTLSVLQMISTASRPSISASWGRYVELNLHIKKTKRNHKILSKLQLSHLQYIFSYHDGDVFGCVADIGWITGRSLSVYGPPANVLFESTPIYPDPGMNNCTGGMYQTAWQILYVMSSDGRLQK